MLQKISIELFFITVSIIMLSSTNVFNIDNKNDYWASNQHYDFWRIMWHWRLENDAEIFKYKTDVKW